jgi:hypothetical protein
LAEPTINARPVPQQLSRFTTHIFHQESRKTAFKSRHKKINMKKNILLFGVLISISLTLFSQNDYKYKLQMRQLLCNHTTEAGEDEVYILVFGKTSDGSYWNFRMPNSSDHWDLNDGNDPREVTNWDLASSDTHLNIGEYATFNIYIMEEDGGNLMQILDYGKQIIKNCPDPRCLAATNIIQAAQNSGFNIYDTDDYIGSFSVTLSRTQTGYSCEFKNFDRVAGTAGWSNNGNCEEQITFLGDGSSYIGTFSFLFNWK